VVVVDGGAVVVVVVLVVDEVLVVVVVLVGKSPVFPSRRARFQAFATSVQVDTVDAAVPAARTDALLPVARVESMAGVPVTGAALTPPAMVASSVCRARRSSPVAADLATRAAVVTADAAANNPLEPQAPADGSDRSRQAPRPEVCAAELTPAADGPTA